MKWQQWILVAWYVFSIVYTVATIGKPRPRVTPEVAAFAVVIIGALLALVISI